MEMLSNVALLEAEIRKASKLACMTTDSSKNLMAQDEYVHDDAEKHEDGDEEMHDAENIDKDEDDQKKRRHDDKDQDPYAGSDQGMKKRKNYLDAKPSKKTNHSSSSKGKAVKDGPEHNSLNDLANAKKPPLTFDDLMSTPINFTTFAMNCLKLKKLTKANLIGLQETQKEYILHESPKQMLQGDFPRLHQNDIEDMLLLHVQNKLFNLEGDVIVDLAVALRIDRVVNFSSGYNKGMESRKWTTTDQRWLRIMMSKIDEQLLEQRIMRNLERLVSRWELEMDYRLIQRTV
nr:hypothetical protein [Tanacetum cinerariifolium]